MEEHSDPPTQATESSALTQSVCQQLCELTLSSAPDLAAISHLASQSGRVTKQLLLRANSPPQGLARPISTLQHAVVFLGAAGVSEVAESLLLRFDDAHRALPPHHRLHNPTQSHAAPTGATEDDIV